MHGHAVVGEQGVQEGAEQAPLWGPSVEGQRSGDVVSYLHHLGVVRQEVQDPIAQCGVLRPRASSLMMSLEGTMVLNAGRQLFMNYEKPWYLYPIKLDCYTEQINVCLPRVCDK